MSCLNFSGRLGGPLCVILILMVSALPGGLAAAEPGADLRKDLASLNEISHPAYLELEVNRLIARYPESRVEILNHAARQMPAWSEYWQPEYRPTDRQNTGYRPTVPVTGQTLTSPGPVANSVSPVASSVASSVTGPPADAVADTSPVSPWNGSVAVGGNRKSGNTDSKTANIEIEVTHKKARWTNGVDIDFDYAEDSRITTDQSLEVQFESRHEISERWFARGIAEYEDDRFSGLDWRASERIGIGKRVFIWSSGFFDVDAGPGLEHRAIESTGQTETEFLGFVGAGLRWEISPQTLFRNDLSVEFAEQNTRTENETRLELKIYGALKAVLALEVENNSDVAPGVDETDIETKLLFAYEFGGG